MMAFIMTYWQGLCPKVQVAIATGGGLCLVLLIRRIFQKSPPKLKVPDYTKNVVYLCQFPAATIAPSISPFAMKVETWLRMAKIPYKNYCSTSNFSKYGQMPFVELNGEQIADSNILLLELQKKFGKQDDLTLEQQGVAHAFMAMMENQTVWSYLYYRFVEKMRVFVHCIKFFDFRKKFFMTYFMPKVILAKLKKHGIARHSKQEIYEFGFRDIQAMSDYLGDKKFMFGDKMTTVDCYMFSHLSQLVYNGLDYPHLDYMSRNCQNLIEHVKRIRADIWPDWEEICKTRLYSE